MRYWGHKAEWLLLLQDTKLVYKHFATLYFVFVIDSAESELGILDLIQGTPTSLHYVSMLAHLQPVVSDMLLFLSSLSTNARFILHYLSDHFWCCSVCGNIGSLFQECMWAGYCIQLQQGRWPLLILFWYSVHSLSSIELEACPPPRFGGRGLCLLAMWFGAF